MPEFRLDRLVHHHFTPVPNETTETAQPRRTEDSRVGRRRYGCRLGKRMKSRSQGSSCGRRQTHVALCRMTGSRVAGIGGRDRGTSSCRGSAGRRIIRFGKVAVAGAVAGATRHRACRAPGRGLCGSQQRPSRYVILNGDTPLLTEATVRKLVALHESGRRASRC